jgi:hypothetical protein
MAISIALDEPIFTGNPAAGAFAQRLVIAHPHLPAGHDRAQTVILGRTDRPDVRG